MGYKKMTSRERVKEAINHREPDRIPIDIGGTKLTGVHVDEYIDIGKYFGIDVELPKVFEQSQMLARADELMMNWFHSDVKHLENLSETWGYVNENWKIWKTTSGNRVLMPEKFNPSTDEYGNILLKDQTGKVIASMPSNGKYFDRVCSTSMSSEIKYMDPEVWKKSISLYTDRELEILRKRAKFLYENTEYSIHGGFGKAKLGTTGIFAGHTYTDWLCLLMTEPEYTYSILQATAERAIENVELYIQAVGEYIDTIELAATDFGTQKAEMFSPEIFRTAYLPNYKKINDYIHSKCDAKIFFHSCGSIRNIIEHLINAGMDILNPVQTSAANMDPLELKEEFGDRIVFWGGGIDTQRVLPFGSKEEIIEETKENIRIFGKGGGFVFTPIHNLQHGVPPENVEAMIKTILQYGKYPFNM